MMDNLLVGQLFGLSFKNWAIFFQSSGANVLKLFTAVC
jgi:hypothetical protein